MILRAIGPALRQLAHPATFRLMLLVAALTALSFALLGAGLWWLFDHVLLPRWLGDNATGAAVLLAAAIALLAGWFLFRAVAMLFAGMFTDGIIASVEEDDYPAIAAGARDIGFARGLAMGLASARRAIGWNLLAAPLYLLLLVTGVGTFALVLIVNAALLGRDLEAMVRARHPGDGVAPLSAADRWLLGLAAAIAFVIPLFNLFAPIFGAALAVHMVHMRKAAAA